MVETSLRGRPSFGTFLQSDANTGRDGVTYYDYQRFLRSQKVALLQEKIAHTHVPGCKSVALPSSRKVFQLKNRISAHAVNETAATSSKYSGVWPADELPRPKPESNDSKEQQSEIALSEQHGIVYKTFESPSRMSVTWKLNDPKHSQTERLPHISAHHHRVIKSATSRDLDHHSTWPGLELRCDPPRPKTVAGVCDRDIQGIHNEERDKQSKAIKKEKDQYSGVSEDEHPQVTRQGNLLHLRHAWSECEPTDDVENPDPSPTERDAMAHAFNWGTTTQRAYDEVGWTERVAAPVAPPRTTIEQFPDPVSQRLTFRRYHSEPASWQVYGIEWDFAQTRTGSFMKGSSAVNYCTSTRKTRQIPGYLGCIPNQENMDNPLEESHPALLIRSLKPRPTNISRRLNIPGYTGHVHWAKTSPTHTKPDIWLCTSERSHGPLPLEDEPSPFRRNGVFSKMITTVSPHNPFNRIDL